METLGTHSTVSAGILKPMPRGRRRAVRQKVHTPAYASLNGGSDDMVLDLSEILDISETGVAIQTSSSWEISRVLNLCLDLSETKSYLHTTGYVVWADRTGRIGVRFPELPDASRRKLQEWLFLNAMVAASNYAASHGQSEMENPEPSPKNVLQPERTGAAQFDSRADYTTTLSALSAVQREVEALGPNLDAALQLIAERVRAFTQAEGSAIALSENHDMVCRASAGDAPPIGAKLAIGTGFSGYCVRTGFLQRCDDAETDTRVDRESCRVLGIRSMIAVPIRLGETVIGLLEVFSSTTHAFNDRHGTMLQRLADTILAAVNRANRFRNAAPRRNGNGDSLSFGPSFTTSGSYPFSSALAEPEKRGTISLPKRHLNLLVVAAVSIVIALAYFLVPWVFEQFRSAKQAEAAPPPPAVTVVKPSATKPVRPLTPEEVRKRAETGDPYEQVALATRYATGEDVPQDYSMAVRWLLRAAEQGHVGAQDTLGTYYSVGRGVPKDITRAYYWSLLARAAGREPSKIRVAFLTSQLTRGQVLAIEQEANKFLKQHPPLTNSESSY
jgi:GAF domain-containing protein